MIITSKRNIKHPPFGLKSSLYDGDLRTKGKGRKLVGQGEVCIERICGATFECHFLTWNKLRFDVADTLAAAHYDILVRMHHNHSTTFPLTSKHTSVNINTLLALYLPNTKCPSRTRFSWATLQSSDWTSVPRPFLSCSCPWHITVYVHMSMMNIFKYL